MYATVFEKDPMDAGAGQRYRREILQPGGSRCAARAVHTSLQAGAVFSDGVCRFCRDEMDSLVAFLGRKPTNDAFLKSLLG